MTGVQTCALPIYLLEDWSLVGRVYIDTLGAWFVCYGDPPIDNLPVILRLTVEG